MVAVHPEKHWALCLDFRGMYSAIKKNLVHLLTWLEPLPLVSSSSLMPLESVPVWAAAVRNFVMEQWFIWIIHAVREEWFNPIVTFRNRSHQSWELIIGMLSSGSLLCTWLGDNPPKEDQIASLTSALLELSCREMNAPFACWTIQLLT